MTLNGFSQAFKERFMDIPQIFADFIHKQKTNKAIRDYVNPGFNTTPLVNKFLYANKSLIGDTNLDFKTFVSDALLISAAMKQGEESQVVFNGTLSKYFEGLLDDTANLEGKEIIMNGFISTSSSSDKASEFGNVMFEINVPKEAPRLDGKTLYSGLLMKSFNGEKEMLLHPGTFICKKATALPDNHYKFELDYLSPLDIIEIIKESIENCKKVINNSTDISQKIAEKKTKQLEDCAAALPVQTKKLRRTKFGHSSCCHEDNIKVD